MSDQPKPTGEWTVETVRSLWDKFATGGITRIADAHNAALAAAWDKWQCAEKAFEEQREQLAAERENSFNANFGVRQERDALLQQVRMLVEMLKKIHSVALKTDWELANQIDTTLAKVKPISDRDTTSRV